MTTAYRTLFSSDIPFSLFSRDSTQTSIHDLKEESKTFLWHQFMLDVLMHIPSSPTDIENVIAACRLVNEYDPEHTIIPTENDIQIFQTDYRSDTAINWYKKDSFLYRAFNKACRMLDTDAVVLFHPVVKDLDAQLKQHCRAQLAESKLTLPLTVFRGLTEMGPGELERVEKNMGGLISMNTFLSTSLNCAVASQFISGADPNTAVIFQITVNQPEAGQRMNTFADISQMSGITDEREILFGVSSVFRIVSVEQCDCNWFIELESTSCNEDPSMQTFMKEIQSYLYQKAGQQIPLVLYKQLFTIDSFSYAQPFVELMRFFFVEIAQLFLVQIYKKEGRMKQLIDSVPDLHTLIATNHQDVIPPNSRIICQIFDLLHDFLYPEDDKSQAEVFFHNNDIVSLLSFGGFLLLTGDLRKGIRYFLMLLNNESIDNKLKIFIHSLLVASYAITKEKELASKSMQILTEMFQSSTLQSIPGWLSTSIVSSHIATENSDQSTDDIARILELVINQEQSDNTVDEKLRLMHLGHISAQQENFADALNHWEEAAEIVSHMPSSAEMIFNGTVFVQMAAAYYRLNNRSSALRLMEKGIACLQSYYPSTHRMFATLYFIFAFYLMQNDQPSEAIGYLKKSLANPHFSANQEFGAIIYGLLATASMQSGDLDSAEVYCRETRNYPPVAVISEQVSFLSQTIPQLKMFVQNKDRDLIRQLVGAGLQFGQQLAAQIHPRSTARSGSNDEAMWTVEELITTADHYRHQQNNVKAESYYTKALEKITETKANSVWNIHRKMLRMDNDASQYQYYFIEQFSKYDDNNPNHFSMIATLQIILYKLSLSQNDYEMAFNCLISSALMAMKLLVHQAHVDSQYISNLLDRFFHHESIVKTADILTKMIEIYSTDWMKHFQHFRSKYANMGDMVALIHHTTVDGTLDEMKSKYNSNPSAEKIFRFLDILLQLLRENIIPTDVSTLPFAEQLLKVLRNYNDEQSPWFYLIKALESLCIGDMSSFFTNIDQFRFQTVTFERYQELKEKLSFIFEKFDENQLYSSFESLTKVL